MIPVGPQNNLLNPLISCNKTVNEPFSRYVDTFIKSFVATLPSTGHKSHLYQLDWTETLGMMFFSL